MNEQKLPEINEAAIRQQATKQSFERGMDYYATGAVGSVVRRGAMVLAEVEGSQYEPYYVEVHMDDPDGVSAFCTCPYDWGGWCKHIVAVLLTLADRPEVVEQRPTLDTLIADLDRDTLQGLVQTLVKVHPDLIDQVEHYVASVSERPAEGSSTAPAKPRPVIVDPAPFRRQVTSILNSLTYMRPSEAYWHVSGIADQVRQVLEKAWDFIQVGDGDNALAVLEGVTEAYVNEWYKLDDSDGYLYGFYEDLATAWTEAVLSADLSSTERQIWIDKLERWEGEVMDYAGEEVFATAQEALRQGWDYAPLVRVLRDGEITRDGAWESWQEAPWYADDLAIARLNVLERQDRHQEYLYLAEAEGQTARYVTKLVELGQVQDAMDYAQEYMVSNEVALALAKALHAHGHLDEALRIAERGLNLEGAHEMHLAVWLREVAEDAGKSELALRAAVISFKASPSLDAYQQVQRLAEEQDRWETLREKLLEVVRQRPKVFSSNAVDVFLYEDLIDEAIQALGQYPYYDTVERVVDAAIDTHPDWCIQACKAQAEPIMDQGKSKHYHHAARWVEKAKAAYTAAGREDAWCTYLDSLLDKHSRKYKLVPMLEALG